MIKHYKVVILTNCPSFYKVNLFNELQKYIDIYVIFLGYSDQVVIARNLPTACKFDYTLLSGGQVENRNYFRAFLKIRGIFEQITCDYVMYSGYIEPEFLIYSYILPKRRNILLTESAGESKLKGLKFWIKRLLLKRYSTVIASGKVHAEVIRRLGFTGDIRVSQGVGLMNKRASEVKRNLRDKSSSLKFLYVGRLIDIKNVVFLIKVFNRNGYPLTIVGGGVLEDELKSVAAPNINFIGFVSNENMAEVYSAHDVFVLPSLEEPWGLVVEEALHFGCTLLLSNRVGSAPELLVIPATGVLFDPVSEEDLEDAIVEMVNNYETYKTNVDNYDINEKDMCQVQTYLNLLQND